MEKSDQRLVFSQRIIDGAAGFAVPGALSAFAVEVLGACRIPFEHADRGVMLLLDSTADVGEALEGVGLRAGGHAIGGAKGYTTDQVQTLLKAFGVEITIGRGEVCDLLTMDVRELVRGSDD